MDWCRPPVRSIGKPTGRNDTGIPCSGCMETFLLTEDVKTCRTKLNPAPCCFSELPADHHSHLGAFISHPTRHTV